MSRLPGFLIFTSAVLEAQSPLVPAPVGRETARIDYGKPAAYQVLEAEGAARRRLLALGAKLRGKDPGATLRAVHRFIASRVPHTPQKSWREWQPRPEQLLAGMDHQQCAEHALLCANLLRAAGIPCVYVKSMQHAWIRSYVTEGVTGSFAGHVFLEVHFGGRWHLLEAQGLRLWSDYDPADPELPGAYLAYEKGAVHADMVHSTRKQRFIAESMARFAGLDLQRLRPRQVAGQSLLPQLFMLCVGDEWKSLPSHLRVRSFDAFHWPQFRARVRGQVLFVTAVGGRCGLSVAERQRLLPDGVAVGTRVRELEDGTRVVLLSAATMVGLRKLLRVPKLMGLALDPVDSR